MSVHPKEFNRDYYRNICLGSEEFKKSGGLQIHPKIKTMIDTLNLTREMRVLDVGCGRGDITLYIAHKVKAVIGVDYSPSAIQIANEVRKKHPKRIQKKSKFYLRKASSLPFADGEFDLVIFIDVLDHLSNNEQKKVMTEVDRVLSNDGMLFLKTCTNNLLLSKTYPLYIYPINRFLTWLDKKIKGVDYDSLSKDPRTNEQKYQHVNEPNYFILKRLFERHGFDGKIKVEIGFIKEVSRARTMLYNFLIAFYPLSKRYPLSIFFGSSFICYMKKQPR